MTDQCSMHATRCSVYCSALHPARALGYNRLSHRLQYHVGSTPGSHIALRESRHHVDKAAGQDYNVHSVPASTQVQTTHTPFPPENPRPSRRKAIRAARAVMTKPVTSRSMPPLSAGSGCTSPARLFPHLQQVPDGLLPPADFRPRRVSRAWTPSTHRCTLTRTPIALCA